MKKKKFKLIQFDKNQHMEILKLKKKHNFHPLVLKYIVKNRIGYLYKNKSYFENIEEYIKPSIDKMDNPYNMPDMKKAISLILNKINKNETNKMVIVGDYDTDGITASAILYDFFKDKFGFKIDIYIPERSEGYGITPQIVEYLHNIGKDFIITVDNGIVAFPAVEKAKELGMTIIITDHHALQGDIPQADAVINAQRPDNKYKYKDICGAGVAFNIARAIDPQLTTDKYMPILAIGTVADVVPLLGDNRIFVAEGTKKLIYNKGLKKLIEALEIEEGKITTQDIGFKIAPLINSAGREEYANLALQLFIEEDEKKLDLIVEKLIRFNEKRKEEQKNIQQAVEEQLEKINKDEISGIVIKPENIRNNFNSAIVGIAASRIVEEYSVPVIIFGYEILEYYITPQGKIYTKEQLRNLYTNQLALNSNIININFKDNINNIDNIMDNPQITDKQIKTLKEKFGYDINQNLKNTNIFSVKLYKNGYLEILVKTGKLKGSGRSTEWFDYTLFIKEAKEKGLLENGGGHKMAAGFTIKEEKFEEFKKLFEIISKKMQKTIEIEIYDIIELPENKEDSKFVLKELKQALEILEPFGASNQPPLIAYDIGNYYDLKKFGKESNHLSLRTEGGIRVIGWNAIKKGKYPVLANKYLVCDIIENQFINEENKKIKWLEFNIKYIINKKDLF